MSLKNILILALSLFMLSAAAVIVKFSTLHPIVLLFWRLLFVTLLLLPLYITQYYEWYPRKKSKMMMSIKSKPIIPSKKELMEILFVSFFLVGHFYTWFKGVPLLPISVASIIYATNPIYTAIIAYFVLKEEYHFRYFISFLMALLGIVITMRHDFSAHTINLQGVGLMIATAIFYSSYMALSKKMRLKRDNISYSFYLNFFAAIISLIILIAAISFSSESIEWITFDFHNWWVILSLAVFASLLGHTLMIYSVAHLNLNFVSIFKLFGPLLSSLMAFLVFGEKMSTDHIIGFLFVASGVIISLDFFNKRSEN